MPPRFKACSNEHSLSPLFPVAIQLHHISRHSMFTSLRREHHQSLHHRLVAQALMSRPCFLSPVPDLIDVKWVLIFSILRNNEKFSSHFHLISYAIKLRLGGKTVMKYVIKRERSTHTHPKRADKECANRWHTDQVHHRNEEIN